MVYPDRLIPACCAFFYDNFILKAVRLIHIPFLLFVTRSCRHIPEVLFAEVSCYSAGLHQNLCRHVPDLLNRMMIIPA